MLSPLEEMEIRHRQQGACLRPHPPPEAGRGAGQPVPAEMGHLGRPPLQTPGQGGQGVVPSRGGKACCLYPAPLASGPSLFLTIPPLLPPLASSEAPGLAGPQSRLRGHPLSCFCPGPAASGGGGVAQELLNRWMVIRDRPVPLAWDLGRTKQVPSRPQAWDSSNRITRCHRAKLCASLGVARARGPERKPRPRKVTWA